MGIICDISIVAIISRDKPSQIQDLVNELMEYNYQDLPES